MLGQLHVTGMPEAFLLWFLFVIIFPYHPLYHSSWKKSDYPPEAENFSFPLGFTPARSLQALTVVWAIRRRYVNLVLGKWSLSLLTELEQAQHRCSPGKKPTGSRGWSWIIFTKSFPFARLDLLALNSEGGTSTQRKQIIWTPQVKEEISGENNKNFYDFFFLMSLLALLVNRLVLVGIKQEWYMKNNTGIFA